MKVNNHEQGSQEWLESRLGVVTASCFDKILSPTGKKSTQVNDYVNKLVSQVLIGEVEETFKSDAMQRGNDLEPEAKDMYQLITGNEVLETGLITHDDYGYGCSPDGVIYENGEIVGGLEIKCPSPANHVGYLRANKIPTKYIPQVQGCMLVTNASWWDFMSYNEYIEPLIVRVERDEEYIKLLEEQLIKACDTIQDLVQQLKEK